MPRGQYDRAAAKAKREQGGEPLVGALDQNHKFGSFGLPPVGTAIPIRAPMTSSSLQDQLEAANERIAKLERLCRTHGLLV